MFNIKILFRQFTTALLILTMYTNHSFAQEAVTSSGLQELARNYGKRQVSDKLSIALSNVHKAASNSTKSLAGSGVNTIAHQGQTLLLIWLLAGVEAVRQQAEISGLKKEELKPEDIMNLAGPVAEQILQSDIWFALAGGTSTSTVFHYPLQLFNSLIENTKTATLLKRFIQVGVASLITFVGWEVGMQLWNEGLNFLESTEDYVRAEKVGTLFTSFFKNSVSLGSEEDKANAIVLKKMFMIMGHILSNGNLKNVLLYNTWRLKLATGEFAVLITSMVSASTVGTAIFPGAGTATGMIFGLTGGVLSLFVPQHTKDKISEGIRSSRANIAQDGPLRTNMIEIRGLIQRFNNGTSFNPGIIPDRVKNEMSHRQSSRNKGITALYEKLYTSVSNLKKVENQITLAFEHTNFSAQTELVEEQKDYEVLTEKISKRIIDFYMVEKERLEFLLKVSDGSELDAVILAELDDVNSALTINSSLLAAINSTETDMISAAFLLVNKLYLVGYDESELL